MATRKKKVSKKSAKKKKLPKRKVKKVAKKKTAKKKAAPKKKKTKAKGKKKKVSASRKAVIKRAEKKVKEKLIGKVIHYYDRIGVAIIDLESPLHLGDTVLMKRGQTEMPQRISSMQIQHQGIETAKRGDIVGIKVDQKVEQGTKVLPA